MTESRRSFRRVDQQAGERDEAGEALGPDHGLPAPVAAPSATARDGRLGRRAAHRVGGLQFLAMARLEQLAPLLGLGDQLGWIEDRRVALPAQHPRDELAARRVVGLEDHAAPRGAVRLLGGADLAVGAEVALHQPGDSLAQEDLRRPLDLAHLPLGAARVVAAVEVLGRREVVLRLGRVGDLAADPGEAKDAHRVALVRVADQIELASAVDEVVRVHLAGGLLVALHRVVVELDRLAA